MCNLLPLFDFLNDETQPFRVDSRTGCVLDWMERPILPFPGHALIGAADYLHVLAAAVDVLDPAGRAPLYTHRDGLYLITAATARRALGWEVEMIGGTPARSEWYRPDVPAVDPIGSCVNFGDDADPEWYRVTAARRVFRPVGGEALPDLNLRLPAARVEMSIALPPVGSGGAREALCAVSVGCRMPVYAKSPATEIRIEDMPAGLLGLAERQRAALAGDPAAWERERIELEIAFLPAEPGQARRAQYSIGLGERLPYFAQGAAEGVRAKDLPSPLLRALGRALQAVWDDEARARQAAATPARRERGRSAAVVGGAR